VSELRELCDERIGFSDWVTERTEVALLRDEEVREGQWSATAVGYLGET
jgi:hypothetical protein